MFRADDHDAEHAQSIVRVRKQRDRRTGAGNVVAAWCIFIINAYTRDGCVRWPVLHGGRP